MPAGVPSYGKRGVASRGVYGVSSGGYRQDAVRDRFVEHADSTLKHIPAGDLGIVTG